MKKRILAILLSLCLLVGLFPVTALAAEDTTPDETVTLLEGSETSPSYDWYTGAEENVTEYTISTAADLLGFANIVNGTAGEGNPAQDSFENKTVKLGADIALTEEWTPVNGFKGEFDGQGHTISNIWNDDAITKKGFFTSISYAYIHNLKLDGVNFSCTEAVPDAYIGSLACGGNTFSVVEDVTVSNVVIKYDNISNSDIGALCGEAYGYSQMRNVTLNNIKIDVQNSTDKYNYIGGFLGTVDNGNEAGTFVIYDNCTAATKPFVGGDESTQSKVETVPAWYGDGTANEFYISNLEELKQFRDLVNSGVSFAGGAPDQDGKINGKHIYLTDDIDLSGEEWTPIGLNKDTAFGGHFYGQGHTISNLMVTQQTNYAGLFGYVRNYGNQYGGNDSIINYLAGIEDLTIHNVTIENATNAGAFAGILDQPADNNWYGGVLQLHNLKLTGNVVIKGTNAGGMFGGSWTEARINTTDLTVDVAEGSSVYGSAIAGGVFASSPHTDLASNIASNIDVSGDKIVGGIAGNAGWKWENVSSTGDVTLNSDTASETGYNVGTAFGMVIDNTFWKPNSRINMTALSGTGTLVVNVDGSSQNTNGHHGNLIGGD